MAKQLKAFEPDKIGESIGWIGQWALDAIPKKLLLDYLGCSETAVTKWLEVPENKSMVRKEVARLKRNPQFLRDRAMVKAHTTLDVCHSIAVDAEMSAPVRLKAHDSIVGTIKAVAPPRDEAGNGGQQFNLVLNLGDIGGAKTISAEVVDG